VLDLGDPKIEACLQKYSDQQNDDVPLWQRPLLVLFTDPQDPAEVNLLEKLQRRVAALEHKGHTDGNQTLLDAARSVVFLNPADVVSGVSPQTSHFLLQAILKRSAVCGLRLLKHLSGRADEGFPLRVHRHGHAGDFPSSFRGGTEDAIILQEGPSSSSSSSALALSPRPPRDESLVPAKSRRHHHHPNFRTTTTTPLFSHTRGSRHDA